MYLLQRLQGVRVYFSEVVGFCHSVVILTDGVNVHQAVVCDLDALEVREKPAHKNVMSCFISLKSKRSKFSENRGNASRTIRIKEVLVFFMCYLPGENVFAGIGVRKGTKLSDHHAFLCDGSHVGICFKIPAGKKKEFIPRHHNIY